MLWQYKWIPSFINFQVFIRPVCFNLWNSGQKRRLIKTDRWSINCPIFISFTELIFFNSNWIQYLLFFLIQHSFKPLFLNILLYLCLLLFIFNFILFKVVIEFKFIEFGSFVLIWKMFLCFLIFFFYYFKWNFINFLLSLYVHGSWYEVLF